MNLEIFDDLFIERMRKWGTPLLRVALGIVFVWFGALKIGGVSPVEELVVSAYPIFPKEIFIFSLGIWEVVIGLGLIFKINIRMVLLLLWVQMAGIFATLFLIPGTYFQFGNPFLLSFEGEFVIKNLVLIAASIVIGGFEVKPKETYDNISQSQA